MGLSRLLRPAQGRHAVDEVVEPAARELAADEREPVEPPETPVSPRRRLRRARA